ncbi:MAG: hypothetical protein MUF81_13670 [Verrucomicrobia bacterium]|nr:hypothetical protein [Verrucomicrobiota bacterium]
MKKNILRIAVLSLLATAIAVAPTQTLAQEKQDKPAVEKKTEPKGDRGIPFHGKITAVDKTAKTVTVGERVFLVTAETRIKKLGKPAKLDDAVVGEEIGGTYIKGDDGKLTAKTLRFGPKPEVAAKAEGKDEAKGQEKKGKKDK